MKIIITNDKETIKEYKQLKTYKHIDLEIFNNLLSYDDSGLRITCTKMIIQEMLWNNYSLILSSVECLGSDFPGELGAISHNFNRVGKELEIEYI